MTRWGRQDYAVMRERMRRAMHPETCDDKGHAVYRVGPYRICRTLGCPVLVVEEKS